MIIELMGQPASGKTFLINALSENNSFQNIFLIDSFYNSKSPFKKAIFIFLHLRFLNINYFRCKSIVKKALSDRKHDMKKFFLRQFILDYILINYSREISSKGRDCVFSENIFNLFSYIFFYKKTDEKTKLFSKLIAIFPKTLLHRNCLIQIKVNNENNLAFKCARVGKTQQDFVEETDFYNDFNYVDEAQSELLIQLKQYIDKIVCFENKYSTESKSGFLSIFCDLQNGNDMVG